LSGPAGLHNNFTGAGMPFISGTANGDGLYLDNTVTPDNTGAVIQNNNSILRNSSVIVNAGGGTYDFTDEGRINNVRPDPVSKAWFGGESRRQRHDRDFY